MPERLRYKHLSGETRRLLRTEGESGRFEFKRDVSAISPDVLVAAANAVVLDGLTEGYVTILVGVSEQEDLDTGLVTGKIEGLLGVPDIGNAKKDTIE